MQEFLPFIFFFAGIVVGGGLSVFYWRQQLRMRETDKENLTHTFQALSAEALSKSNRDFLELAKQNLGGFQQKAEHDLEGRQKAIEEIVKPLKESLEKVDFKIQTFNILQIRSSARRFVCARVLPRANTVHIGRFLSIRSAGLGRSADQSGQAVPDGTQSLTGE